MDHNMSGLYEEHSCGDKCEHSFWCCDPYDDDHDEWESNWSCTYDGGDQESDYGEYVDHDEWDQKSDYGEYVDHDEWESKWSCYPEGDDMEYDYGDCESTSCVPWWHDSHVTA